MVSYIITFILLFGIEVFYLKIATYKGIRDTPNHRSAHTKPTIRGGGIIFVFAFLFYAIFYHPNLNYYFLFSGAILVALVSFIDDLITLSSKVRILTHLISFTLVFYGLNIIEFNAISNIYILIFFYVFSLGFLNIYNFMDGINGITFLNTLISYITLLYLNEFHQVFTDSNLLITLLISIIIFGFFNFRKKAICFAGDIGSITIGFSLIYFALKFYLLTSSKLILLIFSVYLLDGGWTIFERLIRKENVFKAHKRHLYQLLANDLKIGHLYISSFYFFLQVLINVVLVFGLINMTNDLLVLILFFVFLSFFYLGLKFFVVKKSQKI